MNWAVFAAGAAGDRLTLHESRQEHGRFAPATATCASWRCNAPQHACSPATFASRASHNASNAHLPGATSGAMVASNMSDPFRFVSYVPASIALGHAVQMVHGRAMIAVAAGATPEEALQFADDFPEAEVFDSDTDSFVAYALSTARAGAYLSFAPRGRLDSFQA